MCSKHSVQWRSNIDEVVIFGAHTSNSLALSLPLSLCPSLPHSHTHSLTLPHLNSTQCNSTQLNSTQSVHLSPTDLVVHSFLCSKFARSLNYSHLHVITQSFTHSPHLFKYSHIIQLFIHSPNDLFIKANIFLIHCDYVYYRWCLIDKCLASVRPPHHCLLWGEPPVSD